MGLTYQNVLETLPASFRDYIRNNKEWIMILNNAVRRAVMGSRRFNQLSTDAPLPIGITSAPICDKINGLQTYDRRFKFPRADFMLTNFGITDWTNEVNRDYPYVTVRRNFIVDKGNGFVSISSVCFGDGNTREQFVNAADRDLTYIYSNNPHNAEYIVLKYSYTDWIEGGVPFYDPESLSNLTNWGTHYYTAEYVYTRPIYNGNNDFNVPENIQVSIIAGASANKKIDYYFCPQHTFDSLWDSPHIGITHDIDNLDYPLVETCLIDPILMNLIRLEVKKSFYEFIEDTTDPQRIDKISEEIEKETQRVKITLNSAPIATDEYKRQQGSSSPVSTLAGSGFTGFHGWR